MKTGETLITSLEALRTNKIRAFLTALGVIIGVFAVVLLIALVKGVQNYVQDQFDKLGANMVFVMPGRSGFTNDPALSFTNNKLELRDVELLRSSLQDIFLDVNPHRYYAETAKYKNKNYYASLDGTDVNMFRMFSLEIAEGAPFTKSDVNTSAKVCVLGAEVKKQLFGQINPVNKEISIGGKVFKVVGYLKPYAQDNDQEILIPYTTVDDVFGVSQITYITAKIKPDLDVDTSIKRMEIVLMRNLKNDEFSIMSQKEILDSVQNILGIIAIGLAAVAGISLLVGGIGIMNIMLVSVSERISEIGLRKALGATSKNIATQFLFESVILSIVGGTLGLLLAWLGTQIAQNYYRAEIPWWSVAVALLFSVGVGVLFGTYPAVKASKLDPIEALRFE